MQEVSTMSAGEIAFLSLVIGSFAVFAAATTWLRLDYVRFRDRTSGQVNTVDIRLQAQMAE
jgi:hypothetical protein